MKLLFLSVALAVGIPSILVAVVFLYHMIVMEQARRNNFYVVERKDFRRFSRQSNSKQVKSDRT